MDPDQYTGYNNPPFPDVDGPPRLVGAELKTLQRAFGYTDEDERILIGPMAETGKEPVGSMGCDTPLAVLSDRAPTLFNYFHQLFAQVTNPAIDPIREAMVMTLETSIGPSGNTFEESPEHCHRLRMDGPVLTNEKLAKILAVHEGAFEPRRLSLLYPVGEDGSGLGRALERLCAEAAESIDDGYNVLILSDRGVDADHVAIPSLLAVSAVHQHLIRVGTRMQAGLIIETGEAREVHDFALLLGYGAAAVNPYLALDTVKELAATDRLSLLDQPVSLSVARDAADIWEAKRRYIQAINGGLLKVMSKMGISTLQSYGGAQIFEAVGIDRGLIEAHFAGTPSRIEGVGIEELGREALERHDRAFGRGAAAIVDTLPVGGQYQWRRRGELHKWNPATIAKLQAAVSHNAPAIYAEYVELASNEDDQLVTLRGLLELDTDGIEPVPLDQVEPASEIVKRFVTGAMSF